jgi:hypothetical protein
VLADTDGLEIARHIRPTQVRTETCDRNVLAVSLFLVNRRPPMLEPEFEDEAVAFQAEIEVDSTGAVVARADLSDLDADDVDARIADLHYRDLVDRPLATMSQSTPKAMRKPARAVICALAGCWRHSCRD